MMTKNLWVSSQLGQVLKTTSGGTPSRKNPDFYSGDIPWVKSGELDKGLILDTEEKITEEAIKNSSAKKFPAGTLLIALYGATIGKLAFLGVEAATNQAVCGIFQNSNIDSKFLHNFLLYRRPKLVSQGSGGAQPNISQTILKKLDIPIVPLPEQRAIVAKIEALFSDLDQGIADLKKAQEQLKVYRQAVLKKAFEGELTKEWREKHEILRDMWDYPKLGDVLFLSKEKHKPVEIEHLFYVGLEHIEKDTGCLTDKAEVAEIKTVKNSFKEGHILYGKLRPYLNKVYLAKHAGVCSTDILVFSLSERILGNYALKFMLSRSFVNDMSANTSGVNLPRVSTKYIKEYEIPLPSVHEQHQIIQEIESRLSVCDKVEQSITESLEKAQALRQSILKKAFEGTLLTKQEIEKCKQEKDWEPAGVLLERVKAEKQ